jgi:hypothetical protein
MSLNLISHRRRPRARFVVLVAAFVAAMVVPTVAGSGTAHAVGVNGYGFVWANLPTTSFYVADPNFSANSTGGTNTVTRLRTGMYQVNMPGLDASNGGGIVHVTADSPLGTQRCRPWGHGVGQGTDNLMTVVCYNTGRELTDTRFIVTYQNNSGLQSYHAGFAWGHNRTAASYFPDPLFAFNSKFGGSTPVQITRSGTGRYSVDFPGLDLSGGNVQVTAWSGDWEYCKVVGWSATVNVACFNYDGSPRDALFNVSYVKDRSLTGSVARRGAYAWASNSSSTSWYNLAGPYSWNSQGGANWARKIGTGLYEVQFDGQIVTNASVPMVTAYGSNSTACRIHTWFAFVPGARVQVRCHTASGAPADSLFSLQYLTNRAL